MNDKNYKTLHHYESLMNESQEKYKFSLFKKWYLVSKG